MSDGQSWAVPSAAHKYGGGFTRPQSADPSGQSLAAVAGPAPAGAASMLSPSNPLLWVGIIAAATVGLMSYSTSVRVGPVSAAVDVGK